MPISLRRFSDLDLRDPFFDSLRDDYQGFDEWFTRKAEESAYVFESEGRLGGFLYLKIEDGPVLDVEPTFPAARRLKVGTFKINPHGTRLGERFVKKVFDHALAENVEEIYLTVFPKHDALVRLLGQYGFRSWATKTSASGTEEVLARALFPSSGNETERYPLVTLSDNSVHLLAIYPKWHTRLFPDSILRSEDASIVADVSHSNSIHKVYLAAMKGMERLKSGDVLLIYRTSDDKGAAYYRSVVTSVCVVQEYRNILGFSSQEEFLEYCRPYSVFEPDELIQFWRTKRYPHIIRFTYNLALPKRLNRAHLIEEVGIDGDAYSGFMPITHQQLRQIISDSRSNESLVVH